MFRGRRTRIDFTVRGGDFAESGHTNNRFSSEDDDPAIKRRICYTIRWTRINFSFVFFFFFYYYFIEDLDQYPITPTNLVCAGYSIVVIIDVGVALSIVQYTCNTIMDKRNVNDTICAISGNRYGGRRIFFQTRYSRNFERRLVFFLRGTTHSGLFSSYGEYLINSFLFFDMTLNWSSIQKN